MEVINYTIAYNPSRMGEINTFSAGTLDEMLGVCSIYFQIAELYESENIEMVMIKYDWLFILSEYNIMYQWVRYRNDAQNPLEVSRW